MNNTPLGLWLALFFGAAGVGATGVSGVAGAAAARADAPPLKVGSKAFSESVILGEMLTRLGQNAGHEVVHKADLAGTRLAWQALLQGDLDAYPDYTGTIEQEILATPTPLAPGEMAARLARHGVGVSAPLGFENSYQLGVLAASARRLGVRTISDLARHPGLRLGFGDEFLDRPDGWQGLRRRYALPQTNVRGLDHSLAYWALAGGEIDVMDVYTTDALIPRFEIAVLEDDQQYFPRYSAVVLYRLDLRDRAPRFVEALRRLEGKLPVDTMRRLNAQVDVEERAERLVAVNFLAEELGVGEAQPPPDAARWWQASLARVARYTASHLLLVAASLTAAIATAIPLGVFAAYRPRLGQLVLSACEIIQTVPGLALLIFLLGPIRFVGLDAIGPPTAITALFLYSLLPIVRNTHTGLRDIPPGIRESAEALGLPWLARLWRVELPLATGHILAGVKTTAVINVGYATLGGLIGAGGYGELIMQGLRRADTWRMLEGAAPAAVLALLIKWLFELVEWRLKPRAPRAKA